VHYSDIITNEFYCMRVTCFHKIFLYVVYIFIQLLHFENSLFFLFLKVFFNTSQVQNYSYFRSRVFIEKKRE